MTVGREAVEKGRSSLCRSSRFISGERERKEKTSSSSVRPADLMCKEFISSPCPKSKPYPFLDKNVVSYFCQCLSPTFCLPDVCSSRPQAAKSFLFFSARPCALPYRTAKLNRSPTSTTPPCITDPTRLDNTLGFMGTALRSVATGSVRQLASSHLSGTTVFYGRKQFLGTYTRSAPSAEAPMCRWAGQNDLVKACGELRTLNTNLIVFMVHLSHYCDSPACVRYGGTLKTYSGSARRFVRSRRGKGIHNEVYSFFDHFHIGAGLILTHYLSSMTLYHDHDTQLPPQVSLICFCGKLWQSPSLFRPSIAIANGLDLAPFVRQYDRTEPRYHVTQGMNFYSVHHHSTGVDLCVTIN